MGFWSSLWKGTKAVVAAPFRVVGWLKGQLVDEVTKPTIKRIDKTAKSVVDYSTSKLNSLLTEQQNKLSANLSKQQKEFFNNVQKERVAFFTNVGAVTNQVDNILQSRLEQTNQILKDRLEQGDNILQNRLNQVDNIIANNLEYFYQNLDIQRQLVFEDADKLQTRVFGNINTTIENIDVKLDKQRQKLEDFSENFLAQLGDVLSKIPFSDKTPKVWRLIVTPSSYNLNILCLGVNLESKDNYLLLEDRLQFYPTSQSNHFINFAIPLTQIPALLKKEDNFLQSILEVPYEIKLYKSSLIRLPNKARHKFQLTFFPLILGYARLSVKMQNQIILEKNILLTWYNTQNLHIDNLSKDAQIVIDVIFFDGTEHTISLNKKEYLEWVSIHAHEGNYISITPNSNKILNNILLKGKYGLKKTLPQDSDYTTLSFPELPYTISQNDDIILRKLKLSLKKKDKKGERAEYVLGSFDNEIITKNTIMLIGEAGTGKTTLLNGIINYISGVKWEDEYRYILETPEDTLISIYIIPPMQDSLIKYPVKIIDTAGLGQGLYKDKQIVDAIKNDINDNGNNINTIGLVLRASSARLSVADKLSFKTITDVFGRRKLRDLIIMTTFADIEEPAVLHSIKEAEVPHKMILKFNNSALFKKGGKRSKFLEMYWKLNNSSFEELFKNLKGK